MVAGCAGSNVMHPWACLITGTGASLIYLALSNLCVRLRIDDPLDAFAVHFGGGLWGLITVCWVNEKGILYAIFSSQVRMDQALAVRISLIKFIHFQIFFSNSAGRCSAPRPLSSGRVRRPSRCFC